MNTSTPLAARPLRLWLILLSVFLFKANTLLAQFAYTSNGSAITITGGPGGNVIIPSEIAGLPVRAISNEAFIYRSDVTSVTIPDSVTSIGFRAFYYCLGLTNLTTGNGVTHIGDYAFGGCSSLTSANIGSGVNHIGEAAFGSCSSLTSVTIPGTVTSIGIVAFAGCSSLTSLTIPGSVATMGRSVFGGCTGLTSVIIGNGVTSIPESAFLDCTSLVNATIPGSVTSIGASAFMRCSSLATVTIPGSVTSIGNDAFRWCSGLGSVTISSGVKTIGRFAFQECPSLTSLTMAYGVTSLGEGAFSDSGLSSVTIPASVASIGQAAFAGCTGLTSATFEGNAPSSFGSFVFSSTAPDFIIYYHPGATGFTSPWWNGYPAVNLGSPPSHFSWTSNGTAITITGYTGPGGSVTIPPQIGGLPVRRIGDGAFTETPALTAVAFPDNVTSIGEFAFHDCAGLTSVTIGNGVTSIGERAFFGCPALLGIEVAAGNPAYRDVDGVLFNANRTRLVQYPGGKAGNYDIPFGVTSLQSHAFGVCEGLTGVTIPASAAEIGESVFDGCTGLTVVSIPGSVTSIGEFAFFGCANLTGATFAGDAPAFADSAFYATAPGFTVYFRLGATGFTTPEWRGYPAVATGLSTSLRHRWSFDNASDSMAGANLTLVGNATLSAGQLELPGSATPRTHYATIPVGGTIAGLTSMTVEAWFTLDTLTTWSKVWVFGTAGGDMAFIPRSVTHPRIGYAIPGGPERNTGSAPNPQDLATDTPYHVVAVYDAGQDQMRLYIDGTLVDSTDMGGGTVGQLGNTTDNFLGAASFFGDPDIDGRIDELRIWNRPLEEAEIAAHAAAGPDDGLTWTYGDLVYERRGPGIAIIGYTGAGGQVDIPAQIDGLPVTAIGNSAFENQMTITGITLPAGITSIGDWAFSQCTMASSISLGDSIVSIGYSTFYGCQSMTSIDLPNSLASIGNSAFEDCFSLTSVTIPGSVASIGVSTFLNCNFLTSLTIGEGVTTIATAAFRSCRRLGNITIPASVTSIGNSAFTTCVELTRATFTGNAPALGTNVFGEVASGFTVYYHSGSTGFTSPLWNGYPALMLNSFAEWPMLDSLPADKRGPNDRNGPLDLPNLLAFAMGLDPLEALPEDLPALAATPSEGLATFRYRRSKNSAGIVLAPMTSTSLSGWSPAEILDSAVVQNGGAWEVVEIEVAAPTEGSLFFRLDADEP